MLTDTDINIAERLEERSKRLQDNTIDLAIRVKEARELLEWHTNNVSNDWIAWMELSNKVLEDIRAARMVIGTESSLLLRECAEVRKFFMSTDHDEQIKRLREFIELCARLRSLKNDGTLDKLADTILKLS